MTEQLVKTRSVTISVILCTYNPRKDYLRRVLAALAAQTLEPGSWELILVDNASNPPVPAGVLDEFKNARLIREEKPGKPNALVTGLNSAMGDLLVTVDDDNLLAPNYLENLLQLATAQPEVGVFSASIEAEFEVPPSAGAIPYLQFLAVRELSNDIIGTVNTPHASPIGAGMAFRRAVANAYIEDMHQDPVMLSLGRQGGTQVGGADDSVFGYAATELGLKCGAFQALRLVHLMPASRVEEQYLHNLAESLTYSHTKIALLKNSMQVSRWKLMKWRIALLIYSVIRKPASPACHRDIIRGKLRAVTDFLSGN